MLCVLFCSMVVIFLWTIPCLYWTSSWSLPGWFIVWVNDGPRPRINGAIGRGADDCNKAADITAIITVAEALIIRGRQYRIQCCFCCLLCFGCCVVFWKIKKRQTNHQGGGGRAIKWAVVRQVAWQIIMEKRHSRQLVGPSCPKHASPFALCQLYPQ